MLYSWWIGSLWLLIKKDALLNCHTWYAINANQPHKLTLQNTVLNSDAWDTYISLPTKPLKLDVRNNVYLEGL